ncbi:hypothetical protein [Streptomyces sp. Ncost-T10-10d]|uniref:hypothetical protein n=1 Tax=Streptomyces sp. Ncost-T10-10d TaxID=1839774 RepID=UPI002109DE94|nr:hypothetical protein [Streptomyces sp. Ncost-T10-10d]
MGGVEAIEDLEDSVQQVLHALIPADRYADRLVAAFFFSSDITAEARPIAIDGSRHLIERGDRREAVCWITATFARCRTVLAADAPDQHLARLPAFQEAVADLGVTSTGDLLHRAEEVTGFLPRLRQTAGEDLAAHADIIG